MSLCRRNTCSRGTCRLEQVLRHAGQRIVDAAAQQRVRAGLQQARVAAGSLAGSAAEYVTEESRDVVGREELNAFHDDVDAIRDDVERLAVRIGRLAARAAHRA